MAGFNDGTQIRSIKGLSSKRRLPRLGRIKLGFMALSSKGTSYPVELPFFLLPDELAGRYGMGLRAVERAKELGVERTAILDYIAKNGHRLAEELPVMLPLNTQEDIFPQSYRRYGSNARANCIGNGEIAMRYAQAEDGTYAKEPTQVICPCPDLEGDKPKCSQTGFLQVMVYEANMGGIYQITVRSFNSIVDVNSGIEMAQTLIGRAAMLPMILRRVPTITHGSGRKETHYTMQLLVNIPAKAIDEYRSKNQLVFTQTQTLALEAPEDTNPRLDAPDIAMDVEVEGEIVDIVPETEAETEPIKQPEPERQPQRAAQGDRGKPTVKQVNYMRSLLKGAGCDGDDMIPRVTEILDAELTRFIPNVNKETGEQETTTEIFLRVLTSAEASKVIEHLKGGGH